MIANILAFLFFQTVATDCKFFSLKIPPETHLPELCISACNNSAVLSCPESQMSQIHRIADLSTFIAYEKCFNISEIKRKELLNEALEILVICANSNYYPSISKLHQFSLYGKKYFKSTEEAKVLLSEKMLCKNKKNIYQ